MPGRSYVGIDRNERYEWIVVVWNEDKIFFSRPFKNTATELHALVRFISEHGNRPKICLKPVNSTTLKLIKLISSIPDVEVVLMSDAGLKMHLAGLHKAALNPASQGGTRQAL